MKLVHIVGARPQFIKMRPMRAAIRGHNRAHARKKISEIIVYTGQHYGFQKSRVFFQELQLEAGDLNFRGALAAVRGATDYFRRLR